MTKYDKLILAKYTKRIDNEDFEVVVLLDLYTAKQRKQYGSIGYYNVHIISERFKDEELNTLDL